MKITKTVRGLPQMGVAGQAAVGKVAVPSKPGRKDVKMTIINKVCHRNFVLLEFLKVCCHWLYCSV